MATIEMTTLDTAIERLRVLAVRTITTHSSLSERCPICNVAAPCEQAVLAAHNIELVSGLTTVGHEATAYAGAVPDVED